MLQRLCMYELSRFVREQGRWYYIDGHNVDPNNF